ncbi:uncharacterized protein VDAG_07707 [Verticillium dahliae VdLs.17]|uniref:Uncharacterized protein n=1 Tax=Verticillium dahliae (strain VdLs.17 / ATCC MYA-4575 / FGSC 10137) TaxID=498257 RepID=G2XBS1_VERDV|nr:uncharacterized protein VDAG_07707 [Verticillium dahliae VdLs.17]EGY16543.1 hypothetical protein VDAG_07707 [Verticillium dahliae VdLs.17]
MSAEIVPLQNDASQRNVYSLAKATHDRIKALEDVMGRVNSGTQSLVSKTSTIERRLPTSSPLARTSSVAELKSPFRTTQQTPTKGFPPVHSIVLHSRRFSLGGAPPRPLFQPTPAKSLSQTPVKSSSQQSPATGL